MKLKYLLIVNNRIDEIVIIFERKTSTERILKYVDEFLKNEEWLDEFLKLVNAMKNTLCSNIINIPLWNALKLTLRLKRPIYLNNYKHQTTILLMKKDIYYKTKLLSVDAWRDGDGWTWNNWQTIEDGIYLHESVLNSSRNLLKFCREKLEILTDDSKGKVQIDDDGYNVNIQLRTGETLFAFCYGEYLD